MGGEVEIPDGKVDFDLEKWVFSLDLKYAHLHILIYASDVRF